MYSNQSGDVHFSMNDPLSRDLSEIKRDSLLAIQQEIKREEVKEEQKNSESDDDTMEFDDVDENNNVNLMRQNTLIDITSSGEESNSQC